MAKRKIINSLTKRSIIIIIIAVIGSFGLFYIQAASISFSQEAENGNRTGNVSLVTSDSTASGNSYIRFGTNGGSTPPVTTGQRCSVLLHGAGVDPARLQADEIAYNNDPALTSINVRTIQPFSNNWTDFIGNHWGYDGPHNFQYDPDSNSDEAAYQQYVSIVRNRITQANCGPTYIEGGSNGGGFLAKMFCRGEDFGGRIWGVYLKDPVMDTGVLNCNPSSNIKKAVVTYSDELEEQKPPAVNDNYRCRSTPYGWYCNDDTTMSVAEYTKQINAHGKIQVPVIRGWRKHIYEPYPITDELHLNYATAYGSWWRYYY